MGCMSVYMRCLYGGVYIWSAWVYTWGAYKGAVYIWGAWVYTWGAYMGECIYGVHECIHGVHIRGAVYIWDAWVYTLGAYMGEYIYGVHECIHGVHIRGAVYIWGAWVYTWGAYMGECIHGVHIWESVYMGCIFEGVYSVCRRFRNTSVFIYSLIFIRNIMSNSQTRLFKINRWLQKFKSKNIF